MNGGKCAAAIEPGTYTDFTGYVCFAGTEAWVEHATFKLVEAFDYDEMETMLAAGETALAVGSLAKCRTSECRISDGPYVDWKHGEWKNGTWKSGVWHDGTWRNGIWKSGLWMAGVWYDGTWENGIWYGGSFLDGTFLKGLSVGAGGTIVARIWNTHEPRWR